MDGHGQDSRETLWGEVCWEALIPLTEGDLRRARRSGDRAGEADALSNLTFLYTEVGRKAEAVAAARRDLALRRKLRQRTEVAGAWAMLAAALEAAGALEEALVAQERAVAAHRRLGPGEALQIQLGFLGRLRLRAGDFAAARAALEEGLAQPAPPEAVIFSQSLHGTLSEVCEAQGDLAGALAHGLQALGGSVDATASLRLARLHRRAGRIWEARQCLIAGVERAREAGLPGEGRPLEAELRRLDRRRPRALRERPLTAWGVRVPGN